MPRLKRLTVYIFLLVVFAMTQRQSASAQDAEQDEAQGANSEQAVNGETVINMAGVREFFWDTPVNFSEGRGGFPQTASSDAFAVVAWQEAESRAPVDAESSADFGDIYIALAVKETSGQDASANTAWVRRGRVAGPFAYAGTEPSIFSITVDRAGKIFLCVAASPKEIKIYVSEDKGMLWSEVNPGGTGRAAFVRGMDSGDGAQDALVPKLFQMKNGSYELFIVRNTGQRVSLYFARSTNGRQWSAFQPFVTESGMPFCYLPYHIIINDKDVIVFQSFISTANYSTFQLYLKHSADSGLSWSRARRLSDFADPYMNTNSSPDAFNNQRPHLSVSGQNIFMVWERSYGASPPSIYGLMINDEGSPISQAERLNTALVSCNNPIGFSQGDVRYCLWFDNRHGADTVIAAVRIGAVWENSEISRGSERAIFARHIELGGFSYVFWQELTESFDISKSRIMMMGPDRTAPAPDVSALNFLPGTRTAADIARVGWTVPEDTSGISGFSWSWSQDSSVEPQNTQMALTDTTSAELVAGTDGAWYFKIKAVDFAGNWSDSTGTVFVRDKTPPPPVDFIEPRLDGGGFLLSNTFTLHWLPVRSSDLEGYAWQIEDAAQPVKQGAALRVMSGEPRANYENYDNGRYRVTVYSIDDIGNVSEGRSIIINLNKYVPHTFITWMDFVQDFMGDIDAQITGRGFSENGNITKVSFVPLEEGEERTLGADAFVVTGDRHISLKRVENLKAGIYYVTVEHPVRGIARSPSTVTVAPSWTYKFGDFTKYWEASWIVKFSRGFKFDVWVVISLSALLLFGLLFARTLQSAALVVVESRALKREVAALLHGTTMSVMKKQSIQDLRRGVSLRLKLALFTVALVSIVIGMVSTPLYIMMISRQRQTLMQSLWDRSSVLLESLSQGARTFLPTNNVLELGFLPAQSAAVREANYVTITGFGSGNSANADYVWASNDANIEKKITTKTLEPGISRISDEVSGRIKELESELNAQARLKIGALADTLAGLYRDGARFAMDENNQQELARIDSATREMSARISEELSILSSKIYSVPYFNIDKYDANSTYMLLKPVMFRHTGSDIFVRGWVRLEVSSTSIENAISYEQQRTLFIILIIALAAIMFGAALSFILATFIVLPLRDLVRHVALIRDTEDKSLLSGHEITAKSSDEIGELSGTINEMTSELVKAAVASQDLSIGKEIQKKFIPLEVDDTGNKKTTGYKDTENTEFFGYYEGAKGVSGDYFDYRDLDGRYWAIIKCDVAGKGIPAALIMVQVATMFINFFRNWQPGKKRIENLVCEINAFIEELGFKGRFAAFTLCLFDSETGAAYFCNAGDNILHIYSAKEKKLKEITLPQTPAAGVLPNEIIEMRGGYKMQTVTIDRGDMLLFYTDGIEEAKRIFRDSEYNEIECNYNNAPRDTEHGNHHVGQNNEEFGADRVHDIINAVISKGSYELYKYHNPHGDVKYHFDFRMCSGNVEETIMALVSIEKIFRICKMSKTDNAHIAKNTNRILVDKKIDKFLRAHFREYNLYLSESADYSEDTSYMYYLNMTEDEQYDDLTILGLRRK